jgi:hypothetical protein
MVASNGHTNSSCTPTSAPAPNTQQRRTTGSGLGAAWNMNKNTAYKALPFDLP